MRVLFTTPAGIGHINPTVPLARAMAARGHDVVWAVPPDGLDRVRRTGIVAVGVGTGGLMQLPEVRRRYPELGSLPPADVPNVMFGKLFGAIAAPVLLADLVPVALAWRPDLVVADAADFAGHVVAAELGVPSVTKGFGPLLPEGRVAAAGAEVAPLWRSRGLEPRPYGGAYDRLYLDVYPSALRAPDADHVPHRQLLRPVTYDEQPEGPVPQPLRAGPGDAPLVYVTMGTVFNGPELIEVLVDTLAGLDVRVLATVGPEAELPIPGRYGPHVRVERYVPHAPVLEACDVVVSHAGSGTVLAALTHGRPQLCLPQGADQFLNADAVASSGAGISLMPGETTADAVRDAVIRLLADETFGDAALRTSTSIASMPSPDDVAAILESLP